MKLQSKIARIYSPVSSELKLVDQKLVDFADMAPDYARPVLQYAVGRSGKRVRPVMTLLAASVFGEIEEHPIKMAAATELLHLATLIHDDTIDNADLRRGADTISKKWGNHVAVLIGDYIFAKSAVMVCETGNTEVVRRFAETIMELSSGELKEYFDIGDVSCDISSYWNRIYNKTASLFATATESGAVLAGASEQDAEKLKIYGNKIGMAFQVMDDVLDITGSSSELGKPAGNDLAQGVMTLPSILFCSRYSSEDSVKRFMQNPKDPEIIMKLSENVRDSSIIGECEAIIAEYCAEAIAQCNSLPRNKASDALITLVEYLMERQN